MAFEKAIYNLSDVKAADNSNTDWVRGTLDTSTGEYTPSEFGPWLIRYGWVRLLSSQTRERVDIEGRSYDSNEDEPATECLVWGAGELPNEFIYQDSDVAHRGNKNLFLQVSASASGGAYTSTSIRALDEHLFMGEDFPDADNWDSTVIYAGDASTDDLIIQRESVLLYQPVWGGGTGEGSSIPNMQMNPFTLHFGEQLLLNGIAEDLTVPHSDYVRNVLPRNYTSDELAGVSGAFEVPAPSSADEIDDLLLTMQWVGLSACADTGAGAGIDKIKQTSSSPKVNWTWWVGVTVGRRIRDLDPEPQRYGPGEADIEVGIMAETPVLPPPRTHSARRKRDQTR